jgi:hypothetical protein
MISHDHNQSCGLTEIYMRFARPKLMISHDAAAEQVHDGGCAGGGCLGAHGASSGCDGWAHRGPAVGGAPGNRRFPRRVSLERLLDESPRLQFASECQRF